MFETLFQDRHMFDSNRHWRKAGFSVDGEGVESNIMVASHPSAPGYLFKKYSKKVSLKDQNRNFRARIEGANKLRRFIATQGLSRIVVPQKSLLTLPSRFKRKGRDAYVLVVEKLDLLSGDESRKRYGKLDSEGLRQLCAAICRFRGLDSGVRNVPFTKDGRIAFIDTERWESKREGKVFLHRIRAYLDRDQQRRVDGLCKAN